MTAAAVRLAVVVSAALLAPGCVGVVVLGTDTISEIPDPSTRAADEGGTLRADDLLAWRGAPDSRVRLSESAEDWIYDGGTRWSGLVLCAVLPIPLLAPLSSLADTYHVLDGVAIGVDRVVATESGAVYGFVGHGFGGRTYATRAPAPLPRRPGARSAEVPTPPLRPPVR